MDWNRIRHLQLAYGVNGRTRKAMNVMFLEGMRPTTDNVERAKEALDPTAIGRGQSLVWESDVIDALGRKGYRTDPQVRWDGGATDHPFDIVKA